MLGVSFVRIPSISFLGHGIRVLKDEILLGWIVETRERERESEEGKRKLECIFLNNTAIT